MTNRKRAQALAERVRELYMCDDVQVCWNAPQAKKHGHELVNPNTIGFACIYNMESGESVTAVVPIAKSVLFDKENDFSTSILETIGRYLQNHLVMEMWKELEHGKPF